MGDEMKGLGKMPKYLATFWLMFFLLTALLVLSALIPRAAIQKNMERSAKELCRHKGTYNMVRGLHASKMDPNADAIWLSIAYGYDSKKPLSSVLWSKYRYEENEGPNVKLLEQVRDHRGGNREYLRYWHGGNVLVRLLHLVTDIRGIYRFNGFLMIALLLATGIRLWKSEQRTLAIGWVGSLAAAGIWFVPFCLEYTWVILWTMWITYLVAGKSLAGKWENLDILFLLDGMVTVYLDFFTTESLSLLLPLLLAMGIHRKLSGDWRRSDQVNTLRYVVLWLVGYVGMWISKWILAAMVLQIDPLPYVRGHAAQWLGNEVYGKRPFSLLALIYQAVAGNLSCLFPLCIKGAGLALALGIAIAYAYLMFVYRQDSRKSGLISSYLLLAMIPFVRILVLHSHGFQHYFFTYRAFGGSVLALYLILMEETEGRWLWNVHRKRRT